VPEAFLAWGKCYKKLQCNLLPFHGENNNLYYKQYYPCNYCEMEVNCHCVILLQKNDMFTNTAVSQYHSILQWYLNHRKVSVAVKIYNCL